MSIAINDAIKSIEDHISVHRIGQYPHIKLGEALDLALTALQEKAVRDAQPQPLTMAELRSMDGKAVYCLELNTEVRVVTRKTGWITVHWPLPMEKECCKAHGLTLYRRNPNDSSQ